MQYYSTNHHSSKVSLKEALTHSEAADGGLYMPEKLPSFPQAFFNNIEEMSAAEISYFVSNNLLNADIPSSTIKSIGDQIFKVPLPLVEIEKDIYAFELFHGPTGNVKDIALRFCARCLSAIQPDRVDSINVLVATSGNSGNAVANGFLNLPGVNIWVLYPKSIASSRIEPIRNLGSNVKAIAINGTIEDCRMIVSKTLADKKFNEKFLCTSANSINIGRILPQTICFFVAYAALKRLLGNLNPKETVISVPCGNCGNLLAGYFSMLMGLPIGKLIAACNTNGAFGDFLEDGVLDRPLEAHHTLAHALDCCRPSNLPRFYEVCKGNLSQLKEAIESTKCTDQEIRDTIQDVHKRTGYILDPHSAVAYKGLKEKLQPGQKGIVFATAHPSKSAELIKDVTGEEYPVAVGSACSYSARTKVMPLPPTYPAFKKYLTENLSK